MHDESYIANIIINADDVGYCTERDRGIFECVEDGIVRNVSVMVNGMNIKQAACVCKRLSEQNKAVIGLHINFTEGKPIHPNVPTLVDQGGYMKGKMGFRNAWSEGLIDRDDILKELHAQFSLFHNLLGFIPHHVDSHQHTHQIPTLAELLIPVLVKFQVKSIRIPTQSPHAGNLSDFLKLVHKQASQSKQQYIQAGIFVCDAFVGLNIMGNGSVESLLKEIDAVIAVLPKTTNNCYIEWMCHPGYVCDKEDDFTASTERENELYLLLGNELRELLDSIKFIISEWPSKI